ncbi:DUF1433 domain-containing protein [Priestia koreensis]|uniref:DUF1433 domain-containing protein n=1 Tax=Priestia koreensis TaxID=284581 RepID=UPI003015F8E2
MRKTSYIFTILALSTLLTGCGLSPEAINARREQVAEQKEAERYAKKMKPAIKKALEKQDINHFIASIHFQDDISISPMGYIVVKGYINNDPDKYTFTADLLIDSNKVNTMSTSPELTEHFIDKEEEARLLKEAEEEERNSSNSN